METSCLCISVCCPALPKGPVTPEPSQGHTHVTAGAALTPNSTLAASACPCGRLGLLAVSVLADCREVEVRGNSEKHWGIGQDRCGLTGASRGAAGRREQLHPCRVFSGMWALAGGWLLCVNWFMMWFHGFCFTKVLVWGWVSTCRAACAAQNSWQCCGRMALLSYQLGKLSSKGSSWPIPWGSEARSAAMAEHRESLLPQGSLRSSATLTLVAGPAFLQGNWPNQVSEAEKGGIERLSVHVFFWIGVPV